MTRHSLLFGAAGSFKAIATPLLAAALLAACGGGGGSERDVPSVSTMQGTPAAWGRTMVVTIFGTRLQDGVTLTIDDGCINLTRIASGTQDTQQYTCDVRKLGDIRARVYNSNGSELGALRVNVPMPQVSISAIQDTTTGTFVVELDPERAPITVLNFLNYVNSGVSGFYVGTLFHRVIPGFVVQAGGFTTGLVPKTATQPAITLEANNGLKNLRGTIAMARTTEPNSATSQFFVNLVDNPGLDVGGAASPDGYAVFGKVISGLETIDLIATVPTNTRSSSTGGLLQNVPVTDVRITAVRQIQ